MTEESAFPHAGHASTEYGVTYAFPAAPGMTLRDWFAGQALQGLML